MKLNLQLFATKSIEQLAKEVIQGKYGNGQARKNALGSNYAAVQSMVNSMLNGSSSKTATAPKATTTPTAPKATTAPAPSPAFNYVDPTHVTDAWNKANSLQKPVEQESAWLTQLNDTLNKVLNKEKFTYDLNGDALYQQYKDQAVNQGKMAMFDTIGQASAMTGGYGNSYAQSVGQQAYQGYLQQLNDKVPELYQLALSQYNQEQQDLKDQASILHNLVQQDKQDYRYLLDDYYKDRDYYTDAADSLSKTAYERALDKYQTDYTLSRDAIEDALNERQMAVSEANLKLSQDEFDWKKKQVNNTSPVGNTPVGNTPAGNNPTGNDPAIDKLSDNRGGGGRKIIMKSDYDGWTYEDFSSYLAGIRSDPKQGGAVAAKQELNDLIKAGVIKDKQWISMLGMSYARIPGEKH